ncbi:MAG TPA: carboxypeptidase-like regulatory domain-containing protein, partial [Thermoanaerobaculia bacterium]|nr:carboxypeptidase-like regulatory domain-containing protein [Thermoanaerobaculia bacterium]
MKAILLLLAIEGFVHAPDGTPVDGATVTARYVQGATIATTKSEQGRFAFQDLPNLVLDFDVQAEGFAPASARVTPYDSQVNVALRRGAPEPRPETNRRPPAARGSGTIGGVVRVGNEPLAGAPVVIQGISEDAVEPITVVTDAKGRYEARGLAPIRYAVHAGEGLWPRLRPANHGRMYEEGAGPQIADLQNARAATVDLELVLAPLVTGRVTDAAGKPVTGARVQVVLAGRSTLDFAQEPFVRTSHDGRFAIPAPPFGPTEMAQVAVMLPAHATARSKSFQLGERDQRVDVTLPKFESVTVRVTAGEGKPVPRARVAFVPADETASLRGLHVLFMPMYESRVLTADAAGELVLHLTPGTYDFAATAEGFQVRTLHERPIARPTNVELQLEQAFAIKGRVHRKGRGVPNVHVQIVNAETRDPIATDKDGRFEIGGLARGKYALRVLKHDELIDQNADAEAPGTLDIALPPAGTLHGRVLDAATRQPVREFVYSIESAEAALMTRGGRGERAQRGEPTAEGAFSATLPTGRYRVTVSAAGYTRSRESEVLVTEQEPANVEILLDRGITVAGRVLDENGAPLREANVFVMNPETNDLAARSSVRIGPGSAVTGDDGSFSISGLESGTVYVIVRRNGYVPYRKAYDTDTLAPLEISLERGLSLSGVVQRGGKPVADVEIGATTAAVGGDHQPTRSDANGRFTLHGLIAARYTIHAYKEDLSTEVRNVDPTQKRELVIDLDPKPRGTIYGTVSNLPENIRGKIVRRAVFAQGEDRGAEAAIDEAGNYRIEEAPTGTVWVVAQVESPAVTRSSVRRRVDVQPGQPVRVDLDLGAAVTVRGRVTFEGKPLASTRVVFTSDESSIGASATTRADGTYEAALPAPGVYRIFAHAERADMRGYEGVREIRGGETIDIDIREHVIEGIVVDAETRMPIAGAVVTLTPEVSGVHSVAGESITDANGRFRIVTSASGAYRAIASATGYAHQTQSMRPQMSFELARTEGLHVRVVDARTGTPLDAHLVVETLD